MRWVEAINRALEKGRFELYAQRIVPVSSAERSRESGRALHLELLVRLIAEDGRHIPPGVFLPAAERFNLVSRVDRWVIENAFDWVARQQRRSDRVLCSINLSGASIGEESFLAFVLGCLDAHGIPGDLICFEITETAAIANLSMATRFIHELRQRGCSFALDDFGSGLSSFAYLKSLPVQFLKIDGVFVKDMAEDPLDRAMVRAINDVGQLLGMRTIAEFVESPQILEHLAELGVDAAQGYHIDRPSPLEQIEWASGTDEDYPLSSRSSASIS
jgi:EAL domain-containing protein (putative c-di-GMP-specific phosphodiesterase class I)